jgi:hypothetical protein
LRSTFSAPNNESNTFMVGEFCPGPAQLSQQEQCETKPLDLYNALPNVTLI